MAAAAAAEAWAADVFLVGFSAERDEGVVAAGLVLHQR